MVFARALVEPTNKESRGLAPGHVHVDQPFHYKQAISSPENNPARVQNTERPKTRYVTNPGLLSKGSAAASPSSAAGLDQPFQYKQVQSVPKEYENPAGIKQTPVPVEAMIPNSIADSSAASSGEGISTTEESPTPLDDWEEVPRPNLVTPIDGSMAKQLGGPSPEDATVNIESGVLPVPVRQTSPLEPSSVNPNDIASQSHVDKPTKDVTAYTGVSPEDATVQVQSDVLSVPIRKMSSPQPQKSPAQGAASTNPNDITYHSRVDRETKELRAPTGSSMARAYKGITPEDAAHVSSGVMSVPVPENSGSTLPRKAEDKPAQPRPINPNDITRENVVGRPVKNLVSHTDSSMAKAYAEIEDFVHVKSGVLSVPIRKRSGFGAGSQPKEQEEAPKVEDPINPNDITGQSHVDKPIKTLVAPTASSMARVDMAGPGDRPLPNPSGIISFPDTRQMR